MLAVGTPLSMIPGKIPIHSPKWSEFHNRSPISPFEISNGTCYDRLNDLCSSTLVLSPVIQISFRAKTALAESMHRHGAYPHSSDTLERTPSRSVRTLVHKLQSQMIRSSGIQASSEGLSLVHIYLTYPIEGK